MDNTLSEVERRALHRTLLIVRQAQTNPNGIPNPAEPLSQLRSKTVRRAGAGRPSSLATAKMLAQYEFDTAHFEALRKLGWDAVPPNKRAIAALVAQLYPNDPKANKTRMETIERALKRERAKRRR